MARVREKQDSTLNLPHRELPGAQQDLCYFPGRMLSYFFPIHPHSISSYYSFIRIDFSSLEHEPLGV